MLKIGLVTGILCGIGYMSLVTLNWKGSTIIHIAVVACGDRLPEALVMLKSALLMSAPSTGFRFHIFADNDLQADFKSQLNKWQAVTSGKTEYTIYDITYPRGDAAEWRKLFKPCATQRIFLPELITKTNHLLYVDTDVLFVSPVEEIWTFFTKFNATQLSALALEHEDERVGWYNRYARHPYYPPLGVNSGMMLMRLDRMRDSRWVDYMVDYFKEYRLQTRWGDQDLINIFFHFFPEKLYLYPCEWNYRTDHCTTLYINECETANTQGVKVLHGSRGVYRNDNEPAFKAVFEAFRDLLSGFTDKFTGNIFVRRYAATSLSADILQDHVFYPHSHKKQGFSHWSF